MEEFSRGRSEANPSDPGEGGAVVRTPSRGDSSSPGSVSRPVPPSDSPTLVPGSNSGDASDSPTLIDIPGSSGSHPSDSPTLVEHPSDLGPDSPTMIGSGSWPAAPPPTPIPRPPKSQSHPSMLQPGAVLGQRYEILQILGEGGMGAVYKARDRELDRMVALKVIRPELAGSQAIIDRFKQELLLATQVTHKNVIRIYDLGEAEGMKFITMEFVEGEDLRSLMHQKQKLPPVEAVEIMLQVCRALEAAHSVGIIHRDLKPQNIMRDKTGRILVMDFGLARTLEGDGMTQTGALVGTMDYMSPEQALGKELDQRSDLFTLGLIFYELLTGKMPYKADSVVASLLKRTQERAAPVSSHDASIPRPLSDIVGKCMDPDVKLRYQSAGEILADLEAWQGGRAAATLHFPSGVTPWGRSYPWHWFGAAAAVVVLALVGFLFRGALFGPSTRTPAGPVVSVAVVPFRNASGDASLDWMGRSLAEMLSTDVGQSAHVHIVPPDRMQQILRDLRLAADATLDEGTLRRLAEFSNADQLLWGQYARFGDHLRIDATLRDLKRDRSVPFKIEGINEKDLPGAVDQLARSVQENLNVSSSVVQEMRAAAFKPSTKSVQALRYYSEGLELGREGNYLEAQKRFLDATKEDPQFALAYSKLAQTYASLGYDDKAADFSRKAVELSSQLPSQERYLILANQALVLKDNQKAIESYENLAKVFPEDSEVKLNLARLYQDVGSYDKARDYLTKILVGDPKNVEALLSLGFVEIQRGNPKGSLDYLNQALSLAIQLENAQAKGSGLHLIGLAYRLLGKWDDALRNDQESAAIRRQIGDKRGIATSLAEMARVQEQLGKRDAAFKNYQEALQLRREMGDRSGTADILIDIGNFYHTSGKHDEALKLYKETLQIQRELGNPAGEANALGNAASIYAERGQYEDGLTYFQQALQLWEKLKIPSEIGQAEQNIAYVYSMMGQFDEAVNHYLRALEVARSIGDRESSAIYSHNLATVFESQGRYGAALKAKEEAVNTLRQINERGYWLAAVLSSYGNELSEVGRFDEAQKTLGEALTLAREIQNSALIAQTLNYQGDRFFYLGDYKAARPLFEQASQTASATGDRSLRLISKTNLARVDAKMGRSRQAVSALRALIRESDAAGSKYSLLECSLYLGEALLSDKNYPGARQELEDVLRKSEKLGARTLLAKSHHLLATALRSTNHESEASQHYEQARQVLAEIRKDAGSDALLKRSDLSPILAPSH